jgi:multiple sugar transport system permease protein
VADYHAAHGLEGTEMMTGSMPAQGRAWRRLRRSEFPLALLFISPWILGFLWFQLYPIVGSIYYSFTSYNIMQPPVFIGLSNFQLLFGQDPLFRQSLTNTLVFTLVSVPLNLTIAFIFALLLNQNIPGRAIFRTCFYFPSIEPSVAMGTLWIMLLRTRGGLVNVFLGLFGIHEIAWLSDPNWTMPALILAGTWTVGPTMVIFLAGLQDVPRVLYEAAQIDGAGPLHLVRHVTVPMISPVILFNLVIGLINALQAFTLPYVIFGGAGGGPLNSVLLYSMQLFQVGFKQFQMGYAAAMAWILFIIIFVLSLLSMRLSLRLVHYE